MVVFRNRLQLPLPPLKVTDFHNSDSETTMKGVGDLFDLDQLCVLGHGSQGIVYKVRHRQTLAIYALKVIPDEEDTNCASVSHELEILRCTNSPFIVKCQGISRPRVGEKAILMEYMDAGTLDAMLRANGPFPEASLAHIAHQLLKGLNYLQQCNIVHLDIKPSNILVNKDMNVKIADFGVSKIIPSIEKSSNYCNFCEGTYAYMSPERLDSQLFGWEYVFAGDVWSLGVTLLELYLGHFPFFPPGKRPSWMELVLVVCFGELIPPTLQRGASEEFRTFIMCCLEKEPSKRWTVSQLLSHPFVKATDQ